MILAAFSCIFQSDVKALAAYSSITHIRFVICSLLFISISGKTASLLLMLAHGYTSTLIFYFIGEFYSVANTRIVYYFNSFINSRKSLRLFWNFGSMLGMILVIQVFTGFCMALYYVADRSLAFDSVQYIIYETNYG
uniref:Cytochrome b n=1 Tax=Strongyloides venezuelensis TaxID=75913 RepID=A0A0K0FW44_STRVS